MIPDAVTIAWPVGLTTTSTGTAEAARLAPRSASAGEDVVVAVLLRAQ